MHWRQQCRRWHEVRSLTLTLLPACSVHARWLLRSLNASALKDPELNVFDVHSSQVFDCLRPEASPENVCELEGYGLHSLESNSHQQDQAWGTGKTT